jgi:Uma2 family endonuclease
VAQPAPRRRATYQDVLDAPPHRVAELIAGVPYTHPRPASPHSWASTTLGEELGPPFKRGRGGPGGWVLLDEPELHFGPPADADVLVPDLAGWRRERMPQMPEVPFFDLAPDWVCEVVSPSTEALDRGVKLAVYARHGVRRAWLVDPIERTLEVDENDAGAWRPRGTLRGDARARVVPFDAIELELAALWAR